MLVRKQALQSLTRCVQAHPEKESVQRLWLSGALPLVLDPESTVLEKAVETVEELVVGPLCQRGDSQLAWSLLAQVGQARFKDHHKYLQQAVLQLHRLGKIRWAPTAGRNTAAISIATLTVAFCWLVNKRAEGVHPGVCRDACAFEMYMQCTN